MKLKDVDIKEIAKLLDQHESKAKIASMYHVNKYILEQLERRYKMHGLIGYPTNNELCFF